MSVRSRHLIAYAASMFSLMLLHVLTATDLLATMSDYGFDVFYTLISQLFCMGLLPLVVLLLLRKDRSPRELFIEMRYTRVNWKPVAIASVCLAVLITPFTMAFNAITNLFFNVIGYKRGASVGTIYLGVGDLFIQLFLTALLPAIFEEFTHRGVLLRGLEDRGSELTAVAWCGVLFGLMHGNPAQMIYATFGGFLFALVVIKTGSIVPAMVAHFANNAVSVFLDYSTQRGTTFGKWYDSIMTNTSAFRVLVTVGIMVAAVYGAILLLQYLARKNEKPISPRKFLGVVSVDGYKPNGKAMLRDNICLYALVISESLLLVLFTIWGVLK